MRGEQRTLTAERDNLAGQLQRVQQALDAVQREREGLADQLAKEQAAGRRLADSLNDTTAARDGLQRELGTARNELDRVEARLREADRTLAETRDRLAESERAREGLAAELTRSRQELAATRGRAVELEGALAGLRGRLPESLGGSASLAVLKDAAAASAAELRRLHPQIRRAPQDASLLAERERLAERLRAEQLLVAGANGAAGLYRLRPEDTLAQVAARFYGASGRWPELYSANGHILDDPDRVIPGLTLVLP